jgi:hypothetical protein
MYQFDNSDTGWKILRPTPCTHFTFPWPPKL